ncbi:hypothetical protein CsatB_002456 [Cannabis sativa]
MHCITVKHRFSPLIIFPNICSNSNYFGIPFRPKICTNINTTKSRLSSTCYPIKCSVVHNPSSTTTIVRRSGNYEPPIWSFDYIHSLSSKYKGEAYTNRLKKLENDVKMMLLGMEINSLAQLEFIDTLQRLGISYHFKNEINTILKKKYTNNTNIMNKNPNYDLYATSLEFRLLREYGFVVPQEIFNDFKDDETGEFKASISDDIMGALALYEASFYGRNGESVLEEARIFTTKCLEKYKILSSDNNNNNNNNNNILLLVDHALEMPLHWRITKSEARWFIEEIYEKKQDMMMNSTLLEFAKLDFNIVQSTYQEELKYLSRWWKHSKLGEKLPFVRDRLMECFMWQVGIRFEPEFSYFRIIATQIYVLITIIDDMHDIYATLEELQLFANALQRWDLKVIDELPDYMKMAFFILYNFTNEMVFNVLGEHGFVNLEYFKKLWIDICKHQLQEAKWFYSGYQPTLQEYTENAWISVGGPAFLMHAYFCFTNLITNEEVECLKEGYPNIVRHGSLILRLADDLGTCSDEMKRGDVPTSIQCYMHDTGVSEDEAREHIKHLISESWKEMNNENGDHNSSFSKEFVHVCKNLGRASQFIYQYGDGHASQNTLSKDRIFKIIINPFPYKL